MRVTVYLLVVAVGLTDSAATGTEPTSPPTESRPPVEVDKLSGAELFVHKWTANADVRRAQVARPDKEDAGRDNGAVETLLPVIVARPRARAVPTREGVQTNVLSGQGDGLGPLYNATSCGDCHDGGGAAGVQRNVTLITVDPRSEAVTLATAKHGRQLFELFPGLLNERGELAIETVVHDQSTGNGYGKIRNRLGHYIPDGIEDAWFVPEKRTSEAIAERPVVAGRHGDVDFYLSQRNPPPLFGLGLIDRIATQRLARLAEVQAQKTEGRVTGRVALKFGWRGQISSLTHFVSQACAAELGLTHKSAFQAGDPVNVSYTPSGLDMTDAQVLKLIRFVTSLPAPSEYPREQHTQADVFDGESVFNSIGCVVCHVPDVPPVTDLFSDLLLHDMGAKLQAPSPAPPSNLAGVLKLKRYQIRGPFSGSVVGYFGGSISGAVPAPEQIARPATPQFPRGPRPIPAKFVQADVQETRATAAIEDKGVTWDDLQREWRTPPLWGVSDTAPYLHDGRAETLEDAILWHGGEAQRSRDLYEVLKPAEKEQLLAFLSSLRAPTKSPRD